MQSGLVNVHLVNEHTIQHFHQTTKAYRDDLVQVANNKIPLCNKNRELIIFQTHMRATNIIHKNLYRKI